MFRGEKANAPSDVPGAGGRKCAQRRFRQDAVQVGERVMLGDGGMGIFLARPFVFCAGLFRDLRTAAVLLAFMSLPNSLGSVLGRDEDDVGNHLSAVKASCAQRVFLSLCFIPAIGSPGQRIIGGLYLGQSI